MLARRMPTILPAMSFDEAVGATRVHSVAGLLPGGCSLVEQRPFRAPHHTISDAGLVGGGAFPRPGEISLAHNGVLFLDELPEFRRSVLEVLRQPIEERAVTISRAAMSLTYPADFVLVAAMNPCPCGHLGDPKHACTCSPSAIERYRARISGPLLDRIDLHVEVPAVGYQDLADLRRGESSSDVRQRVSTAREIQSHRFNGNGVPSNARMRPDDLRRYCRLDGEGSAVLEMVVDRLGMSARAFDRIQKVARTVADLAGAKSISAQHVSEAVQYRSLDRRLV